MSRNNGKRREEDPMKDWLTEEGLFRNWVSVKIVRTEMTLTDRKVFWTEHRLLDKTNLEWKNGEDQHK